MKPGDVPSKALLGASSTGRWVAVFILVVAGLSAYSNNYSGEFIFDDYTSIVDNPNIRSLSPIWPVLLPPPTGGPLAARPIPSLTVALNYFFGGLDVRGYHLVNNLIHILAALSLFGIIKNTLLLPRFAGHFGPRANWYALAVGLLWALHPLQTESVNYIIQRTETLMGLFYLLTLYCAVRGFSSDKPRSWYMVAVVACALGMGSKEVMVSAPLLVLLYDRLFVAGSFMGALQKRRGFYGALAATWLIILFYQLNDPRADSVRFDKADLSVVDYFCTQMTIIVHYLRLSFWPHTLVLDSQDWPIVQGISSVFVMSVSLLGVLAGATVWGLKRAAWWSFPGVWFFFILAPSSSVVPILTEIVAERRMYLPLAAVIVLVVFTLDHFWKSFSGRIGLNKKRIWFVPVVLLVTVLFGLSVLTWDRNRDYQTAVGVWTDTVAKRPGNSRAHENLGKALVRDERMVEAIEPFREALRLSKDSKGDPEVYSSLGAALSKIGQFDEAVEMHRKSLELLPDDALTHYHLGNTYIRINDLENAILSFQKSLALDPEFPPAHGNLGALLMQKRDFTGADIHFQTLIKLAPQHSASYMFMANLRVQQGWFDEAVQLYRKALQLEPGARDIEDRLNSLLARQAQRAPRTERVVPGAQ